MKLSAILALFSLIVVVKGVWAPFIPKAIILSLGTVLTAINVSNYNKTSIIDDFASLDFNWRNWLPMKKKADEPTKQDEPTAAERVSASNSKKKKDFTLGEFIAGKHLEKEE